MLVESKQFGVESDCEGRGATDDLKDRKPRLEVSKTAYGFGGRKVNNHLYRNVVVGTCPIRKLNGDQDEKAKGRKSVGRKVPSS